MHDLRYDAHAPDERTQYDMPTVKPPPAQAFAQLRQTFAAAADAIDNPNGRYSTPARIDPADLRTVPAPDLRAPNKVLWLAWRWTPAGIFPIEVLGIFSDESKARAVCIEREDGIGPLVLDEFIAESEASWEGAYYPLARGLYMDVRDLSAYGTRTSTDRIDALTAQVDALREQQAAIAQKLRWISEQLALLAGDVPFAGRIAEDECGHA